MKKKSIDAATSQNLKIDLELKMLGLKLAVVYIKKVINIHTANPDHGKLKLITTVMKYLASFFIILFVHEKYNVIVANNFFTILLS